ncbi:MAG: 16S rRNA (uracil(1498)-N(3))-methyltransferase [Myxococcota bacterium]
MRRVPIDPGELGEAPLTGRTLELSDAAAHYLRDVLRLSQGEVVELFDGRGRVLRAALARVDALSVFVDITRDARSDHGESPVSLTLYQAIPKGDRWEWVLEKVTELGIERIVPLHTQRSVVRVPEGKQAKKLERWARIAQSAARQCGRTRTPEIDAPRTTGKAGAALDYDLTLLCSTDPGALALDVALETHAEARHIALFVGPEGGWTAQEERLLEAAGAVRVTMGPRILRSETAGVVAVALAQHKLGDLR